MKGMIVGENARENDLGVGYHYSKANDKRAFLTAVIKDSTYLDS